ncbi:delta(14)-sterol reductase LBR-like [Ptychodera flava]|uniref:delta(14)-sterol reductase LBR-like n=1 Tax=Ptychodera flava TaxID=63121 RepID=UPI00396A69B0
MAGEEKGGKIPRTTEFEFMGPIGSVLMLVSLPLTVYYLYFACQPESCSVFDLPQVTFDLSDYLDRDAVLIFIGWMLFQTLLYLAPIGTETEGVVLRNGTRLIYKINAFYVVIISFAMFGLGVYYDYPLHVLYDKYLQLATTAIIFSYLLSLYLYIKAAMGPPSAIAPRGNSGYFVYDFFMGHELNPRIGKFDLKYFCELRPGLIGWALLNFGMVLKIYERGEQPTAAILLVCFFQAVYVVDALWHEKSILTTMDIVHDGFGFMLVFGDLAWVPFTYSLQARYLVDHPVHLSNLAVAAIIGLKLLGFMIFRGSNSQKDAFRRNPNDPALKHLKSIPTQAGSRLLVSGWWGMVRHPNYLGDILMAISWSLPCGFNSILPWFYPLYFIVLLIHREWRDSHECKKKYGQDWDHYCSLVKYRIVPYVY